MKPLRVYVDTSVFGGCFDADFARESTRFFDLVRGGRIVVLVSQVVVDELSEAPPQVRELFRSLAAESVTPVDLTPETIELRDRYVAAGIVSRRFMDDATHVAAATIARADAIVSWNFRHIVRVDKMRAYNQVNLQAGFGLLSIVSPQEVRFDEDD
jgi:predicted nucleic acid-binding protein